MAPGLANARPLGSAKSANAPTPRTDKAGKCTAVALGGWAQLELTDAWGPWVHFIFSKGFVPKSRLKHRMTLPCFFNQRESCLVQVMGWHTCYIHYCTVRRFQLAPPWYKIYRVGGRGWRGCIYMETLCIWKMMKFWNKKAWKTKHFCMWQTGIQR